MEELVMNPRIIRLFLLAACLCILLRVGLTEEVIATERQIAVLPCSAFLKAERTSARPTLLRWFQVHYHKPIYTLDVRLTNQASSTYNWSAKDARHFPSPDFEGRLYLEISSTSLALRIDPVLYEDHGRYTCHIEFKSRRSITSSIDLQVVVPPKGVILRDQSGRKVEGVIGPFNLGETLIITCEALGGKPQPLLTWAGASENHAVNITKHGLAIVIPCLKRAYQWTHYTCTAMNSNITMPKSITATLEINLPPLDIEIEKNLEEPFNIGQELTITCRSTGSHPRAHIRWCIDGISVTSKEVITDGGKITTSYHKRKITASDNGKLLECIVTNPSIPSYVSKRSYTLVVYYKPEVSISIKDGSSNAIYEGINITVMCKVLSNPEIYEQIWLFEGKNISNSSGIFSKNDFLFIQDIRRTQAGNYTCKSINSEGTSTSSVYVHVKHTPVCKQIEISAKYHGRQDNDDSNVTCSLYSNPGNVTFYWMTRNSSSNHSWSTGGDSHTKFIPEDALIELLCWGENEVGLQKTPCSLKMYGGGNENVYDIDAVFIVGFVAILCFVILLVLIRKIQVNTGITSTSVEKDKISQNDIGCSHMTNNCVKLPSTSTETDCLTTLLNSEDRRDIHKGKDSNNSIILREMDKKGHIFENTFLLRNSVHDRPRRIKSNQF